jgi:hypothetical protein
MIDMYSQVYGVHSGALRPQRHRKVPRAQLQHILPDPQLVSAGRQAQSIDDSDHNHVENIVSAGSTVRGWKGKAPGTKQCSTIRDQASRGDGGHQPHASRRRQQPADSVRPALIRAQNVDGGKGDAAQIRLVTRYEQRHPRAAGRRSFPDHNNLVGRNIKSKDGNIPIVLKHHIPLLDSIYGLGAFERGKTIQYAMDSLVAMYMAGVQMSIFPPRITSRGKFVKSSSLDYAPGATWIETDPEGRPSAITPSAPTAWNLPVHLWLAHRLPS